MATTAPSSYPTSVVRVQSLALIWLPGAGPATVQSPRSLSNDSVEPSVDTVMSSTNDPMPCTPQSLTYEIDTSTWLPAYADRSMLQFSQPLERPDAAFHSPVVPVGSHAASAPFHVW